MYDLMRSQALASSALYISWCGASERLKASRASGSFRHFADPRWPCPFRFQVCLLYAGLVQMRAVGITTIAVVPTVSLALLNPRANNKILRF